MASTRSVRLDAETDAALEEVVSATGKSVSEVLKEGVLLLRDKSRGARQPSPFQVYEQLDIGPGGYSPVPAREVRRALRGIIAKRHGR